jgi:hypothetical protein
MMFNKACAPFFTSVLLTAVLTAPLAGCGPAGEDNAAMDYGVLSRLDFNRLAVRANLPVYWTADDNDNGVVDPDEVVSLLFYSQEGNWVLDDAFTDDFSNAFQELLRLGNDEDLAGVSPEETERLRLVHADLDYGIPTLVRTDMQTSPEVERAFVSHILEASHLIDRMFARMSGAEDLASRLPADSASRSLFRRNWGAQCLAPRTQDNPACKAIPGAPAMISDLYPAALQEDAEFCTGLEEWPNASDLLNPFFVVREIDGALAAVPYTVAYKDDMNAVAEHLRAAASVLEGTQEDALRAYLSAAAQAFIDNAWEPADEAWSRMNARNSAWYLRIGPDEVYWEPCARKAGFHVTLARINTDSLMWEDKILPVQQKMEDDLAALIGPPYMARKVTFHLPDFIDIVLNAGDDREALGATIGQSLPNWGPVANEGRGRTVAMSNLYTDPDSARIQREQVLSLFTTAAADYHTDDPGPGLLSTILHEATHNFGPAHEYSYKGKTDTDWFGGPLASTMEELKAQCGALWFTGWLKDQGVIDEQLAAQTWVDSLRWAMDHISRGMYTGTGRPKAYSQLSAIQIGFLLDEGALSFDPEATAANGKDRGVFTVNFERLPAAVDKLTRLVGRIKATGDKQKAEELKTRYVDSDFLPHDVIAERILRHPKANFVYSLDL